MKAQIQQHSVAISSLFIALVALSYTTWREEVTERNRNTRLAAFEVLKNLGKLQVIVNETIYEKKESAFVGWGNVAIISDMGSLVPAPVPEKTQTLVTVWGDNWQKLKKDEKAQDAVTEEIDSARKAVLGVIHALR